MSPKQWLALLCFYTTYLFLGASVFYFTERQHEIERRSEQVRERIQINELLVKYVVPENRKLQNEIIQKVSTYCVRPVSNYSSDEFSDPYLWTFYHSVFFSFTVCSTLGYGNIAPTGTFGRYFMILYALIGVPVNGILYTYLGDFFGKTFTGAYAKYREFKMANNKNYVPRKLGMIAQITLYLVPAAVILIILPSCLFTYFEGWPYSVSIYYSFVTLSTIGFGDFIPTFQPHQEREFGIYFKFYQAFVIIWLVFGLSYLLMLISFIARGMRSKKIVRLEHQLSENIKITQHRIWNGVTRDVSYLKTILNEIYMMKIKPVYHDTCDNATFKTTSSSLSCPDLTIYRKYSPVLLSRKRAFSENPEHDQYIIKQKQPNRHSETDLNRIDRTKTFDNKLNFISTAELLSKVVIALGNLEVLDEEPDYNDQLTGNLRSPLIKSNDSLLSNSDNELITDTIMSPGTIINKQRKRAASEISPPIINRLNKQLPHDWTWNGNQSQIYEFQKLQAKEQNNSRKPSRLQKLAQSSRKLFTSNRSIDVENILIEERGIRNPVQSTEQASSSIETETQSFLSKINPFKRISNIELANDENEVFLPDHETHRIVSGTGGGGTGDVTTRLRRASRISSTNKRPISLSSMINQQNPCRRSSLFSVLNNIEDSSTEVLEKTTIADLIRALEYAHTKDTIPEMNILQYDFSNKSKLHSKNVMSSDTSTRRASIHPLLRNSSKPPLIGGCGGGGSTSGVSRKNNTINSLIRRNSVRPNTNIDRNNLELPRRLSVHPVLTATTYQQPVPPTTNENVNSQRIGRFVYTRLNSRTSFANQFSDNRANCGFSEISESSSNNSNNNNNLNESSIN